MKAYIHFVKSYPVYSAMIQFSLLGTFGEVIGAWTRERKIFKVFETRTLILKAAGWAFIAVCIKYAFVGFPGYVSALSDYGFLPSNPGNFLKAFFISASINLQFGPFLIIIHRIIDNLIERKNSWQNIDKALLSLLWFWIPAHTITFMLDEHLRIGVAALLSVALGVILGLYSTKK